MKDPCDDIRDWIYTSLSGNISYGGSVVPVYSFAPSNASMPYIIIGEHAGIGESGAKDCYMWDITTELQIYTGFSPSKAGYVPVNAITNSIMGILGFRATTYGREEGSVAMNNFNVIKVSFGDFSTNRELIDDKIVISKFINLNLTVEEQ